MNKINYKEKFSKCSQLCKPHESNKVLWSIKENIDNKQYIYGLNKKRVDLKKVIKHKNFI